MLKLIVVEPATLKFRYKNRGLKEIDVSKWDDFKAFITSFAPPPNPRTFFSSLSIEFSMFFGFHSSQEPTDTPLLINHDLGELEGAKTKKGKYKRRLNPIRPTYSHIYQTHINPNQTFSFPKVSTFYHPTLDEAPSRLLRIHHWRTEEQ